MKTINQMINYLTTDCWLFKLETHKTYFRARIICGVQARGRYSFDSSNFEQVIKDAYDYAIEKWPRDEPKLYTLEEIQLILETENIGKSQIGYVIERLNKKKIAK